MHPFSTNQLFSTQPSSARGFAWSDQPGHHTDLMLGDRKVRQRRARPCAAAPARAHRRQHEARCRQQPALLSGRATGDRAHRRAAPTIGSGMVSTPGTITSSSTTAARTWWNRSSTTPANRSRPHPSDWMPSQACWKKCWPGGAHKPSRDSIDERIVKSVRDKTGTARVKTVGPWPEVAGAALPLIDSDHDGMPDAWDKAHGLNPNGARDGVAFATN